MTFKLLDVQAIGGQYALNVYHFQPIQGTGTSAGVAEIFFVNIIPLMLEVQHNSVTHSRLEVFNYEDDTDFATLVPGSGNVGLVGGTLATSMLAWSFRLNRSSTNIKNGFKRIGGVSEFQLDGQAAGSGVLPDLAALADAFVQQYQDTDGVIYQMCTIKSLIPPDGIPVYYFNHSATYLGVGSQVSRKQAFSS